MKTVAIRLFGTLDRYSPHESSDKWKLTLPDDAKISTVLTALEINPREVALAVINGTACRHDEVIPEDAEVLLVSPVGGG